MLILDIRSGHFYLAKPGDISNWTRQHLIVALVALALSTRRGT
jgi:hypothetical protein